MLSEPTNFYERIAAILTMCMFLVVAVSPRLARAGEQEPSPTDPTAAPAVASAAPPAPRVEGSLTLTGTVLWDGLRDRVVSLQLAKRGELVGTVVAQDAANLAIARAPDGTVVSVPKSEIVGVQMRAAAETGTPTKQRRLDSGRRQFGGAVALLSFGVPLGLSGTVMLGICVSCLYIHLPLLLPGIALITTGSIAMKRAKAKNAAFRADWGIPLAKRMQLTPTLALGRGGGELGFAMRF